MPLSQRTPPHAALLLPGLHAAAEPLSHPSATLVSWRTFILELSRFPAQHAMALRRLPTCWGTQEDVIKADPFF